MRYDDFEDLRVTIVDKVAEWQIVRPEKLNAMRTRTFYEIVELGKRLNADEDIRVVVGTHQGRGFSAGADLTSDDPGQETSSNPRPAPSDSMGVSRVGMAMAAIDKPTIAAINGISAGAGMSLALSFDIRYVGPDTKFLTVFTRRALGPDCGLTYHLPRLVGQSRALELMYTSREVDAAEAVRIGLANELVDDPRIHAMEIARELAAAPPLSLMWEKREVKHTWESSLQEQIEFEWVAQGQISKSEDVREGRQAFIEKRTANFKGE
ncbi:MAG: enoyl-CoA hydratase/isomerase family protein [Dehalococcoidia bacterium]|nr:enoyl-CoA hydratase/isomerase family protein [Dehalococcoidia bacterium]